MARRGKALILVGVLLIAVSVGLLLTDRFLAEKARKDAEKILIKLDEILPNPTVGAPDTYRIIQMPVLQIEGRDVVAILEIPTMGVRFPILDDWEAVRHLPRRFSGSVYDNSLIIGGSDQPGQFDCFEWIPDGTVVTVTDMTGTVFTYTTHWVQRTGSVDAKTLQKEDTALTLFTTDTYAMEYLILYCI